MKKHKHNLSLLDMKYKGYNQYSCSGCKDRFIGIPIPRFKELFVKPFIIKNARKKINQ